MAYMTILFNTSIYHSAISWLSGFSILGLCGYTIGAAAYLCILLVLIAFLVLFLTFIWPLTQRDRVVFYRQGCTSMSHSYVSGVSEVNLPQPALAFLLLLSRWPPLRTRVLPLRYSALFLGIAAEVWRLMASVR
jgi:hypothetical protein